jgi:hypothetical protein
MAYVCKTILTIQDKFVCLISLKKPEETVLALMIMHVFVLWVFLTSVTLWSLIWAVYLIVTVMPFVYPRIESRLHAIALKLRLT